MDLKTVLTEVQSWPAEDRLRLIEEVWDGLSDQAGESELSEDLKALLDHRLAALDADPTNVLDAGRDQVPREAAPVSLPLSAKPPRALST